MTSNVCSLSVIRWMFSPNDHRALTSIRRGGVLSFQSWNPSTQRMCYNGCLLYPSRRPSLQSSELVCCGSNYKTPQRIRCVTFLNYLFATQTNNSPFPYCNSSWSLTKSSLYLFSNSHSLINSKTRSPLPPYLIHSRKLVFDIWVCCLAYIHRAMLDGT